MREELSASKSELLDLNGIMAIYSSVHTVSIVNGTILQ